MNIPSTWNRKQGYPQFTFSALNGDSAVDCFTTTLANLWGFSATYGENLSSTICSFAGTASNDFAIEAKNLVLAGITITQEASSASIYDSAAASGNLYDVAFTFKRASIVSNALTPKTTYDGKTTVSSKPIASHPKYKTYWNYSLYKKPDITKLWAEKEYEAQTDDYVPADYRNTYRWVKHPGKAPAVWDAQTKKEITWELALSAKYPGVETYLVPALSITMTKKFNSISPVNQTIPKIGSLCAPDKTFGLPNASKYWKIDDVKFGLEEKTGQYFATTTHTYKQDGYTEEYFLSSSSSSTTTL